MSGSWHPSEFPHLTPDSYRVTSPFDVGYNCFAWAAGDTTRRWSPDNWQLGSDYWPSGVEREITVTAFVEAYGTLGYEICDSGNEESGYQKIALYVDGNGLPTHAARQLPGGNWTSKLGDFEDIEHYDLPCLNGPEYGQPALYLRRKTGEAPWWRRLVHALVHLFRR